MKPKNLYIPLLYCIKQCLRLTFIEFDGPKVQGFLNKSDAKTKFLFNAHFPIILFMIWLFLIPIWATLCHNFTLKATIPALFY